MATSVAFDENIAYRLVAVLIKHGYYLAHTMSHRGQMRSPSSKKGLVADVD